MSGLGKMRYGTSIEHAVSVTLRRVCPCVLAAVSVGLAGCIPWADHYRRVEAPGAVYYRTACSVPNGPPAIAYYPFHGIFISVDVSGTVRLGLHVPNGYSVQVNDPTVRVTYVGKSPSSETFQVRAFRYASFGDPPAFHGLPDPYISPEAFGPLIGDGEGIQARFFLFLSIEGNDPHRLATLRRGSAQGTVTLPSLTINGQRYEAQTLGFTRDSYFEFVPLNC